MCLKLVDFGAYGDADEIRSLVVPLLSVLNGVTDLTHEHEVIDVSLLVHPFLVSLVKSSSRLPVTGPVQNDDDGKLPHPKLRYHENEHTKLVMDAKYAICNIMSHLFDIDLDMRLTDFVRRFDKGLLDFKTEDAGVNMFNVLTKGVGAIAGGITGGIRCVCVRHL